MVVRKDVFEFNWDMGNKSKNLKKHEVTDQEAEEVFYDGNKKEYPDVKHSTKELRKIVVGKTKKGRLLFIVYSIRNGAVRVISARDLSKKKEVKLYEKAT